MSPHIISDAEHRAMQDELQAAREYLQDPAPLPLPFEEVEDVPMTASDGWWPEDNLDDNWTK